MKIVAGIEHFNLKLIDPQLDKSPEGSTDSYWAMINMELRTTSAENPIGFNLLTRLRIGMTHTRTHTSANLHKPMRGLKSAGRTAHSVGLCMR